MENKHIELLERWYKERPEYDTENANAEFCWDGPSNWNKWLKQKPKILFLAKEPHSGYQPCIDNKEISGVFNLNIARWKFAIKKICENSNETLSMPTDEGLRSWTENKNDDISIVEVKKKNADLKRSSNTDIMEYAKKDKDFLKEQIDLINPDIVLCCYTVESYDIIYGNEYTDDNIEKLVSIEKVACWKHNNRLVIDFYHPSYWQYPQGVEGLFNLLCELLKNDLVLKRFDWNK